LTGATPPTLSLPPAPRPEERHPARGHRRLQASARAASARARVDDTASCWPESSSGSGPALVVEPWLRLPARAASARARLAPSLGGGLCCGPAGRTRGATGGPRRLGRRGGSPDGRRRCGPRRIVRRAAGPPGGGPGCGASRTRRRRRRGAGAGRGTAPPAVGALAPRRRRRQADDSRGGARQAKPNSRAPCRPQGGI
jgi:hypothetical protein